MNPASGRARGRGAGKARGGGVGEAAPAERGCGGTCVASTKWAVQSCCRRRGGPERRAQGRLFLPDSQHCQDIPPDAPESPAQNDNRQVRRLQWIFISSRLSKNKNNRKWIMKLSNYLFMPGCFFTNISLGECDVTDLTASLPSVPYVFIENIQRHGTPSIKRAWFGYNIN